MELMYDFVYDLYIMIGLFIMIFGIVLYMSFHYSNLSMKANNEGNERLQEKYLRNFSVSSNIMLLYFLFLVFISITILILKISIDNYYITTYETNEDIVIEETENEIEIEDLTLAEKLVKVEKQVEQNRQEVDRLLQMCIYNQGEKNDF